MIKVVLSVEFLKFETILLIFFPLLGAQFKVQPHTILQRAVPDSLMINFFHERKSICKSLTVYSHRCSRFYCLSVFNKGLGLFFLSLKDHCKESKCYLLNT